MAFWSWLESLRGRCAGVSRPDRRRIQARPLAPAESFEPRMVLSVSALFASESGTLTITSDAADTIIVRTNADEQVEVRDQNDTEALASTVSASQVKSLVVNGSDSDNVIDLSGMISAKFTELVSIVVNGGGGNDSVTGSADMPDSIMAGDGNDTINGLGGNDTLNGGAGGDSIFGDDGNDKLEGEDGADTLSGDAGNDTISGGNEADSLLGGDGNDSLTGGVGDDFLLGGSGDDTARGQTGNDTVLGGGSGADVLDGGAGNDAMSSFSQIALTADLSVLDGVITEGNIGAQSVFVSIVMSQPAAVAVSVRVTTTDNTAEAGVDYTTIDTVVTIPVGRTTATVAIPILGDTFFEADETFFVNLSLPVNGTIVDSEATVTIVNNDVSAATQIVFVDFDSQTSGSDHVYSANERTAIVARLSAIYGPFPVQFTTTKPASGSFNTVTVNQPPGGSDGGGKASEVDFRNLNLTASAMVDINTLLGGPGDPAPTSTNFVELTAKVIAHENGHLLGLRHGDAFGPIGSGVHNPPGASEYLPAYPGPQTATETTRHIIGSPVSVGETTANAISGQFFGEREAVKLSAWAFGGKVQTEQTVAHGTLATAQAIQLRELYVPNTLLSGSNVGRAFRVHEITVTGSISAGGEKDFYQFQGVAGQLLNFEVISSVLSRYSNSIDSVIRVLDSVGNAVPYFASTAQNNDEFESTDSILIDLTLPASGDYFVEVSASDATDTGSYELFVYDFASYVPVVPAPPDLGDLLLGGEGDDSLLGADGDDSLDAGNGNDTLLGGVGNDSLQGGDGNDSLSGNAGDDTVAGEADDDTVSGSLGDDSLSGGTGIDVLLERELSGTVTLTTTMLTGLGADTHADFESASLVGGSGSEKLDASAFVSSVTLIGGSGSDTLIGGSGDDNLQGEVGNDQLTGNGGNDTLNGGGNTDTIVEFGATNYTLTDATLVAVGVGAGSDALLSIEQAKLSTANTDSTIDASGFSGKTTLAGGDGSDTLTGGSGTDSIAGGNGDDLLLGNSGNDTLAGQAGTDSLDGGNDTDLVTDSGNFNYTLSLTRLTGNGTDTFANVEEALIVGGSGNNVLTVTSFGGPVTLQGGAGNDLLVGGTGNDLLQGGDGNDTLNGRTGDDTLTGGAGANSLNGGGGTDLITESGDFNFTLTATYLSGNGTDHFLKIEAAQITGGIGNNVLTTTNFPGSVTLQGGAGNDTLVGGAGKDSLQGDSGNDVLTGRGNDDTLDGGAGTDTVIESGATTYTLTNAAFVGAGADTLASIEQAKLKTANISSSIDASGFSGSATLLGGNGNDTLTGGSGKDYINSGSGDDLLTGNAGNDTIFGLAGKDTIDGGAGNDSVFAGHGNDEVHGGADGDTLEGGTGADTINGDDGADRIFGQADNDSLKGGPGNDTIDGGSGNDTVIGGDGDDSITGGLGDDAINGSDGNDLINGGDGDDTLVGGAGNDRILGGNGNDTLLGGDGDDTVNGQAGADRVAENAGANNVTVIPNDKDVLDEAFTLSLALQAALEVV